MGVSASLLRMSVCERAGIPAFLPGPPWESFLLLWVLQVAESRLCVDSSWREGPGVPALALHGRWLCGRNVKGSQGRFGRMWPCLSCISEAAQSPSHQPPCLPPQCCLLSLVGKQ